MKANKKQSLALILCFATIGVSLFRGGTWLLRVVAVAVGFILLIAFQDRQREIS